MFTENEEEEKEAKAEASLHVPPHPQVTHQPHPLLLALIHYGGAGTMPHGSGIDAPNALPFHH